jgi:hypothetical protein
MKKPPLCKHFSLLCDSISDKEKSFYNISTSTLMNPEDFFANKVGTNSLAYSATLMKEKFFQHPSLLWECSNEKTYSVQTL